MPLTTMPPLAVVVLAAGKGSRMHSNRAKVLHAIADVPLLVHVLRTALTLAPKHTVVVVSPDNQQAIADCVATYLPDTPIAYAVQPKPIGTADAALHGVSALERLPGPLQQVVMLYGDTPLITAQSLASLLQPVQQGNVLTLLSAKVANPLGYGRIVRHSNGTLLRIVEQRAASPLEQQIDEINAGFYCFEWTFLRKHLPSIGANNPQNEHYLVDLVHMASDSGQKASALPLADSNEALGINTRAELALAEEICQQRLRQQAMAQGVGFEQPSTVRLGMDIQLDSDVIVGPQTSILGHSRIAAGCYVMGTSYLRAAVLGEGCQILPFCHLENCQIGAHGRIGPYARIRPGSDLAAHVHIGNFVELKNAHMAAGSKAGHLSYLGDVHIGQACNIGAGTITCNYDGKRKHVTHIGDNVFVGSHNTLVAPIDLGDHCFTAAGSTLTEDVPANTVAFGRARQQNRPDVYAKLKRDKKEPR